MPFFLLALTWTFPHNYLVALIIFAVASITDYFDGMLARKHNLITNFGKFLDPLADKMLTTSAFLALLEVGRITWLGSIRLAAVADGGKVVAANMWGKAKTVSQMAAIIVILFVEWLATVLKPFTHVELISFLEIYVGTGLLWISAILTVISGAIYLKDNAKFINYKE